MKTENKILAEELSKYKSFLDRGERDAFSVVYTSIEDVLLKIEKGYEPDTKQLKLIKNYLKENKDSEGITGEAISAIDNYMRAIGKK